MRLAALPQAVRELLSPTENGEPPLTKRPGETRASGAARGPSSATTRPGMTPGERFDIQQVLAQGGLGVVFLARDREIDRTVALKQIKSQWADDEDSRARFLLEARVTGRLEHPGVVPVYALGTDDTGRPYYAMRLIRGESLLEVIDRFHRVRGGAPTGAKRMSELRKLLQRFLDVCNAVDYAHSKGVLHRDLKPSNIMLGKYGETLVVDWGLAKVIGSDEDVALTTRMAPSLAGQADAISTRMGAAIGTPAYMSPEQAAGRNDELGPATDVYSLGATLYHLLTGRLPHEGDDDVGVMIAAAQQRNDHPAAQARRLAAAAAGVDLHEGVVADPDGPLHLRPSARRRHPALAGRRAGPGPPRELDRAGVSLAAKSPDARHGAGGRLSGGGAGDRHRRHRLEPPAKRAAAARSAAQQRGARRRGPTVRFGIGRSPRDHSKSRERTTCLWIVRPPTKFVKMNPLARISGASMATVTWSASFFRGVGVTVIV